VSHVQFSGFRAAFSRQEPAALRIDQFRINNFFRPAAYAVHMLQNPNFKKIQTFTHNLNECSVLKEKSLDFFFSSSPAIIMMEVI